MTETTHNQLVTFYYPDSAMLYKRKFDCAMCDLPVWAHVSLETNRYFLVCGCNGDGVTYESDVRSNFQKWKHLFVNAEQGDI